MCFGILPESFYPNSKLLYINGVLFLFLTVLIVPFDLAVGDVIYLFFLLEQLVGEVMIMLREKTTGEVMAILMLEGAPLNAFTCVSTLEVGEF